MKYAMGIMLIFVAFSCRPAGMSPAGIPPAGIPLVVTPGKTLECTSELDAKQTQKLLKNLSLLKAQIYSLLQCEVQQGDFFPKPHIYIYTSRERYLKVTREYGLPDKGTDGFCDTEKLRLFVWLKRSCSDFINQTTLYHEYTHLLLSHAMIYPLDRQPENSFPFWFSEGIATYAETVGFNGNRAILGAVNTKRLALLKFYMNQNKSLVDPVVSRQFHQGFSLNHYALAWGMTSFIMASPRFRDQTVLFLKEFPQRNHNTPLESFKAYFLSEHETLAHWELLFKNYIDHL